MPADALTESMIEDVSAGMVGHKRLSSLEVNIQINSVTHAQGACWIKKVRKRKRKIEKEREKNQNRGHQSDTHDHGNLEHSQQQRWNLPKKKKWLIKI